MPSYISTGPIVVSKPQCSVCGNFPCTCPSGIVFSGCTIGPFEVKEDITVFPSWKAMPKKKCGDCKGRGKILLLVSEVPCKACKGSGENPA